MADDVLMQKLVSIDRCVAQVHTFVAGDLDRLKDQLVQDAVVLNLQRACEQAIDAASRVVSTRRLGIPSDSAEAFTILERAGLLTGHHAHDHRVTIELRRPADVLVHLARQGCATLDGAPAHIERVGPRP